MRGLATRPKDRFATALDMARALDSVFAFDPVRPHELSAWLGELGADTLRKQTRVTADLRHRARTSLEPTLSAAPAYRTLPPPAPPDYRALSLGLLASLAAHHRKVATLAALFAAGSLCGLLFTVALASAIGR